MYHKLFLPASILAGVVIGAGMFSLPYVFQVAGIATGFSYLALFAAVFIALYFMYADVIVRTPGEHRFVGYSKIYLGKPGFWAALWIGLVELFIMLTIYLILAPSFLNLFLPASRGVHALLFWLAGSVAVLFNTKRIASLEFLVVIGILAIIFSVFTSGAAGFAARYPDFGAIDLTRFFAAGPILFALSGLLGIPEIVRYFRESGVPLRNLKGALLLGGTLPVLAYAGFAIGTLGISKGAVPPDAVSGFAHMPPAFLLSIGALGFLSLISSYVVIGLNARHILRFDLGMPEWLSRGIVVLLPAALYFAGLQDFIKAVSVTGFIIMPLEAIFVILMWYKARKHPSPDSVTDGRFMSLGAPLLFLFFLVVLVKGLL